MSYCKLLILPFVLPFPSVHESVPFRPLVHSIFLFLKYSHFFLTPFIYPFCPPVVKFFVYFHFPFSPPSLILSFTRLSHRSTSFLLHSPPFRPCFTLPSTSHSRPVLLPSFFPAPSCSSPSIESGVRGGEELQLCDVSTVEVV